MVEFMSASDQYIPWSMILDKTVIPFATLGGSSIILISVKQLETLSKNRTGENDYWTEVSNE